MSETLIEQMHREQSKRFYGGLADALLSRGECRDGDGHYLQGTGYKLSDHVAHCMSGFDGLPTKDDLERALTERRTWLTLSIGALSAQMTYSLVPPLCVVGSMIPRVHNDIITSYASIFGAGKEPDPASPIIYDNGQRTIVPYPFAGETLVRAYRTITRPS